MKKFVIATSVSLILAACSGGTSGTGDYYNANNTMDTNNQNNDSNNNQSNDVLIQHLAELTSHVSGDRQFSSGNITFIKSATNDTIESIKLHDNWYRRDILFSKNQNNRYFATPYSYGITYLQSNNNTGYIQFQSDTPLETAEDIKQGFLNALESDTYSYLDNTNKQNAINTINEISMDNAQIVPITEMPNKVASPNSDPNKFYIIPTNMELDVNTYGQLVGLQYSDFGTLTGEQWTTNYNNKEKLGYVFAGGDTDKKLLPSDIQNTAEFTGKAVGQVMLHTEDDNGIATNDYLYLASDATLIFDNGTENINMNFSENSDENKRWYDVNVTKADNDITIVFTNGDKIAQANEKFKFSDAATNKNVDLTNHTSVHSDLPDNWHLHEKANVDIEYYGNNNQVSESVGSVGFVQQEWKSGSSANKELSFSSTFGVKAND